ncbi:MAG: serine/threonine-protein phosphatase [Gammaproteobacteria bacterium HGW-Gammaproteobacteria-1]|jgi:serine/threonine protein phosphatase PrpC|nr:MAG: serine/threonine-protein phosphatase [Gammaproteobacteria bacterium HGW-Gammaproteobacteria-1]
MTDITVRRPVTWTSCAATDVGTVRSVNEDAVLDKPELGLWAVADGMGGHEAGDVASQMIVEALGELNRPQVLSDFINQIENRIIDVNARLLEYSEIMLDGRVSGSTFVSLVIYGHAGACLWMGDSRLYRYRGNRLRQISRDHSQVSELLQAGAITEEEARNHPESNVITRAVGTNEVPYLDMDVFDVQLGDVLLLCSDGLYNALDESSIAACLDNADPKQIVARLIDAALAHGAADNVSVIAVKGMRNGMPVAAASEQAEQVHGDE